MKELLAKLTQVTSPSGYEDNIRKVIEAEVKPFVDKVFTDNLGNLVAVKGTSGPKVMVSAHMDEIGFVATHIDNNGFIRFATVGGVSEHILLGQRMRFTNGTVGTFGTEKLDDIRELKTAKLFIDIGVSTKEEAAVKVNIGDFGGYLGDFSDLGGRVVSKSLDDRAGCAILIEAAKAFDGVGCQAYFVFSTQEEVGCRGARTGAYGIDPDFGIAVDVTRVGDTPESRTMAVSLGKGAAVKVKDSNLIAHPRIKGWMIDIAEKLGIPYQLEVLEAGGTDAGAISLTKDGVPSGTISIPCRYIHTPGEMVDMKDMDACVKLLVGMLNTPLKN